MKSKGKKQDQVKEQVEGKNKARKRKARTYLGRSVLDDTRSLTE